MINHNDYMEAGLRVMPLYRFKDGLCECGDTECMAVGKHPRMNNWQHVPLWSEEQSDAMDEAGFFDTGFGFVLDDHFIIDIDPRNGGEEGYKKLVQDMGTDFVALSSTVVSTGGGGKHIYFSRPAGLALLGKHRDYKGVDFKSTGYVVGAGSLHKSGQIYEADKHDLYNFVEIPECLVKLLEKKATHRTRVDGEFMDIEDAELQKMLSYVSPNCDYDRWINIGMALHDATNGAGVELWDGWSSSGDDYPGFAQLERHWHSFGKSSNPVTLGSLIHYATQGGYELRIKPALEVHLPEGTQGVEKKAAGCSGGLNGLEDPFSTDTVDLLRPPGFVGEVAAWINSQCRFPRERLAVATAINAVGNIGGLRFEDEYNDITANTIMLCVAGSGTGKEAVQQAEADIMREAGLAAAVHGAIKSEQEITRNIVRHQAAYYVIDELGYLLQKIENARKKGGASYLDGVISAVMSIFTKANGHYLIGGDLKDDIRKELVRELAQAEKKVEENEDATGAYAAKAKSLRERAIPSVDNGIDSPFLSMIGYTTPVSFDELVTGEQATNGFIGRCLLVREHETNPRRRRGFKKQRMQEGMKATLKHLANPAVEMVQNGQGRIEWYSAKTVIPTTEAAADMLEGAADWFEEYAEEQKGKTGLEAIVRRGYELMAKVSFILALPGGVREPEHVRWAYKLVRADISEKIRLANTNVLAMSKSGSDALTVLENKIMDACGKDEGEPISVIKKRVGRKFDSVDVEEALKGLVESNKVMKTERQARNGLSVRYKAA